MWHYINFSILAFKNGVSVEILRRIAFVFHRNDCDSAYKLFFVFLVFLVLFIFVFFVLIFLREKGRIRILRYNRWVGK